MLGSGDTVASYLGYNSLQLCLVEIGNGLVDQKVSVFESLDTRDCRAHIWRFYDAVRMAFALNRKHGYKQVNPASATNTCPVMYVFSSPHRNATTLAISLGWASRLNGIVLAIRFKSSSELFWAVSSV